MAQTLNIEQVRALPRFVKRRVWKNTWHYRRDEIPGATRAEKRRNWRKLWGALRVTNAS